MADNFIDVRGLACPGPVIETKKRLEGMADGTLEVLVDNKTAVQNVTRLAQNLGCAVLLKEKDGGYLLAIRKEKQCRQEEKDGLVIQIASEVYGVGDDELGHNLMKAYIYALNEASPPPRALIFINGGVKLACEGSPVLDSLQALQKKGVEIISCGTCLNFYGLSEKLAAGSIGNMYDIVERMNQAARAIKI